MSIQVGNAYSNLLKNKDSYMTIVIYLKNPMRNAILIIKVI